MKKYIGILMAAGVLLCMGFGTVSAADPTGFSMNKHVVVNGDWEYISGWQLTHPPTAVYSYDVFSPESTWSNVMNQDDLGTAWQWEGNSYVETNAETDYYNHFDAWTVNDPATTPATGGYTKYDYSEHTESTNPNGASTQDMTISGFGNTQIYSHVHTDFGSWQGINTKVNK